MDNCISKHFETSLNEFVYHITWDMECIINNFLNIAHMLFDWEKFFTAECYGSIIEQVLYISLHRHEGGRFYPGTGAANEVLIYH